MAVQIQAVRDLLIRQETVRSLSLPFPQKNMEMEGATRQNLVAGSMTANRLADNEAILCVSSDSGVIHAV
jgi:hypothetical protein